MSNSQEMAPLMKWPYEKAMQGNWMEMANYFKENKQMKSPIIGYPITIARDTAFHLAVHSKEKRPLADLIEVLDQQAHLFEQKSPIMSKNSYGNTVLHEAAINGNIEAAKLLKDKYPSLLKIQNVPGETPLFTAAACGETKIVEELFSAPGIFDGELKLAQVHRKRESSTTILQATIRGAHFETALLLLKLDESLAELKDDIGLTALHVISNMPSAFKSGYHMNKLKSLIYNFLPVEDADEVEMHIPTTLEDLDDRNSTGWINTCLNVLHKVAKKVHLSICKLFCKGWPVMESIWNDKKRHKCALKLVKLMISKHGFQETRLGIIVDSSSDLNQSSSYEPQENKNGRSKYGNSSSDGIVKVDYVEAEQVDKSPEFEKSPELLIATSHGIVEIVQVILMQHPQAVEQLNDLGQNILHIAIMHRQKKIYDLIKHTMRLPWARLNRRIDNKGYTILHQIANTEHYTGGTKPGPALRLQEELQWFKRIEEEIPSHYVLHREDEHKPTAEMMFKETHQNDLKNAQQWMKDTSQSCSTVAVLVATVVFAAAYTVPGDYNPKGIPNFLYNQFFLVFTVFDVVSLASSLTSLVMFLSILTSPLELYDFHRSLPRKVMFGLTLLFFSVLTTMVAFGATIAILVQSDKKQTAILISVAACVPVAVFALMLFDLYLSYLGTIKESLQPIRKVLPWFLLPCSRREKKIP